MQLKYVHLEETWVLGIETGSDRVCFLLKATLARKHPRFPGPLRRKRARRMRVRWCLVGEVHWNEGPNLDPPAVDPPAVDPDGSSHYGTIDVFLASHDMRNYALEGDWGSVVISNVKETVEYLDRSA